MMRVRGATAGSSRFDESPGRSAQRRAGRCLIAAGIALGLIAGAGGATRGSGPSAQAAVDNAWQCSGYAYLFQSPNGATAKPHQIQQIDISTGATSVVATTSDAVNAVGYNPTDGFFYGWDGDTGSIVKIGADGALSPVGFNKTYPSGAVFTTARSGGYNTGDFDTAGHLWIAYADATPSAWLEVDLAAGSKTYGQVVSSGTITQTQLTAPDKSQVSTPKDWAYVNGVFYGVTQTSPTSTAKPAYLVAFDPATKTARVLGPLAGTTSSDGFGAAYSDGRYLYVSNNGSGVIYRVDIGAVSAVPVSNGPQSRANDGARCVAAKVATLTLNVKVDRRAATADQFQIAILDPADGSIDTSATTSGAAATASTTNWPVPTGATIMVSEAMVPGSPTSLDRYSTTIECVDGSGGSVTAAPDAAGRWGVPIVAADDYVCTITNSVEADPSLSLRTSAAVEGGGPLAGGSTVVFSFVVTNTGNVPLTQLALLADQFNGTGQLGPITCPTRELEPASQTVCTARYVASDQDAAAGHPLSVTATADGAPPSGAPVSSNPATAALPSEAEPALELVKTASPSVITEVGQQVSYTFRVTNTGNVPITNIAILEKSFTGHAADRDVACKEPTGGLVPGAALDCVWDYAAVAEDFVAGEIDNTAQASASGGGQQVTSDESRASVIAQARPALTFGNTVNQASVDRAGQELEYVFSFTNTGNVPLTDLRLAVIDFSHGQVSHGTMPAPDCPPTGTLEPGHTATCKARYIVTQADIDAGADLVNIASGSAAGPDGSTVPGNDSAADTSVVQEPALALLLTADRSRVSTVGETIGYTFTLTNTGNVTLTSPSLAAATSGTGGSIAAADCGGLADLAPGAKLTCAGSYAVTQADLDAGTPIVCTAIALARAPNGAEAASNQASVSASSPGRTSPPPTHPAAVPSRSAPGLPATVPSTSAPGLPAAVPSRSAPGHPAAALSPAASADQPAPAPAPPAAPSTSRTPAGFPGTTGGGGLLASTGFVVGLPAALGLACLAGGLIMFAVSRGERRSVRTLARHAR